GAVARENILRRGLAKQIKHALMPIAPPASYFPDFLTPEEAHEGLDAGIEAVLSTPKQRVGQELGILRERVGLSNWTAALADGDRTAHATLGHSLRAYHGTVLAPYESVMNKAVEA